MPDERQVNEHALRRMLATALQTDPEDERVLRIAERYGGTEVGILLLLGISGERNVEITTRYFGICGDPPETQMSLAAAFKVSPSAIMQRIGRALGLMRNQVLAEDAFWLYGQAQTEPDRRQVPIEVLLAVNQQFELVEHRIIVAVVTRLHQLEIDTLGDLVTRTASGLAGPAGLNSPTDARLVGDLLASLSPPMALGRRI